MTTSRRPAASSSEPSHSRTAIMAVAWLVLFLAVYFSQPLPNNGGIIRWELWPTLPFSLLDAIDPPAEKGGPPRGVAFLVQRMPLMASALLLCCGAFGAGALLLSVLPKSDMPHCERTFFGLLLGLAVESLLVLFFGVTGWLNATLFRATMLGLAAAGGIVTWRSASRDRTSSSGSWSQWLREHGWLIAAAAPFLVGMMLGAMSPSTDFDVNEYHLGGPKEWYLARRITFLEHNVYTSFPFLTEMLLLAGMVIHGDWFDGALAGQLVLMVFAPLTALGLYCLGRRWFSPLAGALGALVYLTTPWVFRMSIIAYAEGGLTAYTGGAVVAGMIALERLRGPIATGGKLTRDAVVAVLLTGLCAGGAMACKYTGLVMAVAPWAGLLTVVTFLHGRWRSVLMTLVMYFAGVVAMVGPWLVKNLVETGNPVYPLGYRVFDGRDLDDELAEKWRRGHARPSAGSALGEVRDLFVKIFDVATVNDWTNPLVFAFAPLALLWPRERRRISLLWGMVGWLFLCWWLFTHHLDRFWLPLLPAACALAGIGAAALVCHGRVGRAEGDPLRSERTADTAVAHWHAMAGYGAVAVLAIGWIYNLGFCSTGLVGYNAGLTDLDYARDLASRITGPEIAWISAAIENGMLPPETKVLCVGEAELFHARFPYVYNTVFDRSIFEEWCGEPGDWHSGKRPLRSTDAIRETFAANGITHLYVNWGEIIRYRQTYGYTDFVHPDRFAALKDAGVLGEPLRLPSGLGLRRLENLSAGEQQLIEHWAPELIVPCDGGQCVITGQVFPVRH